jgi:hypothetical protein
MTNYGKRTKSFRSELRDPFESDEERAQRLNIDPFGSKFSRDKKKDGMNGNAQLEEAASEAEALGANFASLKKLLPKKKSRTSKSPISPKSHHLPDPSNTQSSTSIKSCVSFKENPPLLGSSFPFLAIPSLNATYKETADHLNTPQQLREVALMEYAERKRLMEQEQLSLQQDIQKLNISLSELANSKPFLSNPIQKARLDTSSSDQNNRQKREFEVEIPNAIDKSMNKRHMHENSRSLPSSPKSTSNRGPKRKNPGDSDRFNERRGGRRF